MKIKPYIKLKKFSELKAGDKIRFKPGEPNECDEFNNKEFSVIQTDTFYNGGRFIKIHLPEFGMNNSFYAHRFELKDE